MCYVLIRASDRADAELDIDDLRAVAEQCRHTQRRPGVSRNAGVADAEGAQTQLASW
jgi:hypothetical protein